MVFIYMGEEVEILLNSEKNISSVNVDTLQRIELTNKVGEILEYNIRNVLSATEIFDAEREANEVYRIYGRLEFLSLINGLSLSYTGLTNFFLPQTTNVKNINNCIKFYLVKPTTGYTNILNGTGTSLQWIRYFEVIATPNDFDLYNAGFSNNVFGEQTYAFNFNTDFNISNYADEFNFPATELFLYAVYQPGVNGDSHSEYMYYNNWYRNLTGSTQISSFTPTTLNVGDRIFGDIVEYGKSIFYQEQLSEQIYYISLPYRNPIGGGHYRTEYLQFKYNPFIPLRLRYFESNLSAANTGSTSYQQQTSIPYYATDMEDGNFVWKNILPQGNIDSTTNLGVDYPFINKRRYLFANILLDIIPNMDDTYTELVFTNLKFGPPIVINTEPITSADDIGKPCL